MTDHIPPGTKPTGTSNSHATWLREQAAWLDASMGYVAIPAARMRDAADEIERLEKTVRGQHAGYIAMLDKAAELERRLADETNERVEPQDAGRGLLQMPDGNSYVRVPLPIISEIEALRTFKREAMARGLACEHVHGQRDCMIEGCEHYVGNALKASEWPLCEKCQKRMIQVAHDTWEYNCEHGTPVGKV